MHVADESWYQAGLPSAVNGTFWMSKKPACPPGLPGTSCHCPPFLLSW